MASNMKVFQEIISKGLTSDMLRRHNEIERLMLEGTSWEEAYRRVTFPYMTKEVWDKMCHGFDEAFGPAREGK